MCTIYIDNHVNVLGINVFLDGFIPTENLRFRETSLIFKVSEIAEKDEIKKMRSYSYPDMVKKMGKSLVDILQVKTDHC